MKKSVYSICGMCTVRCPIRVESEDNRVTWIEGNQHQLGGAMCAKGTAGVALRHDTERPQSPLIRVGARGAGRWRAASWDEAYDYITGKMQSIKKEFGPESVVLSSRGGPWQGMYKAFIHAYGSPNYTNHDCTCGRNTHHASLSINGVGRKGFAYDIKNARHLVLFGRDMFSALRIAENNQTLDMLDNGGRLTDGTRRMVSIQEIVGMEGDVITMQEIFSFQQTGLKPDGKIAGRFMFNGIRPKFMELFKIHDLDMPSASFEKAVVLEV